MMNLLGRWFQEELLNLIMSACQLTCYDLQADMIEFIRTSSMELDLQHNEERQGVFKRISLS